MLLDTDDLIDLIRRQIRELNELLGEGRGVGGELGWGAQITGNEGLDAAPHSSALLSLHTAFLQRLSRTALFYRALPGAMGRDYEQTNSLGCFC